MPRSASAAVQNNFSQGLVTEATGLNFPENACTETSNCVFDERGRVFRRLGIDYETDAEFQAVDRDSNVVVSYYWKAAAGNGDNAFAVVQVGGTLYFYRVAAGALSGDMIDTITLSTFSPGGAPDPSTSECQFAAGSGYLFVSHPNLEPFYVAYDSDADTVSATQIDIKIRDVEGLEDGLEVDERPTTLSTEHEYNLHNQGWFVNYTYNGNDSNPRANVLDRWGDVKSDYPANSDIWYLHLRVDTEGDPPDFFDPIAAGHERGNTPAPKGHFILDAFNQDRSDVSGFAGIDVVSSGFSRPSTIAFFAGRVMYAGVQGEGFSNKVYFSQTIERNSQFGQCYQQNDPSAKDTFDLLATDGGVIAIPDAGTIIKLWPIENDLLVFASNGVWAITGSEGIGFRATDFTVRKASDITSLTASSFVSIGGSPSWWNEEGIYLASVEGPGAGIRIDSLTDRSIKTFYEDIPVDNKRYIKGAFNSRTRVVTWVYRSAAAANVTEVYEFDSALNFNVLTRGLYNWSIDSDPVSINGVIVVEGQASTTALEDVTNTSLTVVTNSGLEDVQASVTTTELQSAATKFLTSYDNTTDYQFTFSEEADTTYTDWVTFDDTGVDFSSYFVTGYAVHGDAQRKFQPNYVYLFNETNAEQNQLDFQSRWDFATSGSTGRFSTTQRVTFPSADYTYQFKRLKCRGHGLALQYRVSSVTGQPFRLIGWSAFETQNQMI